MVFVFHLTDVPLGCQNALLPQAFLRHPFIKTFLSDSDKKPYHDNLCLFRAIAFEKFGSDGLSSSTKYLVSEFLSKIGRQPNFYRCFTEWNSWSWANRENEHTSFFHLLWWKAEANRTLPSVSKFVHWYHIFATIWPSHMLDEEHWQILGKVSLP